MILNYTYVNPSNSQNVLNPDETDNSLLANLISNSNTTLSTTQQQQQQQQALLTAKNANNRNKINLNDRSRPINRIEYQPEQKKDKFSDLRTISLLEKSYENIPRYDLNGQLNIQLLRMI